MRVRIKKQLLSMIDSVEEAVIYLSEKGIQSNEYLISDCRDVMLSIKDFLADIEYREITQICDGILGELENLDFRTTGRKLQKIKGKIQAVNNTYELVFLPYKADVWDAFDSIWRTAKEHKSCNVKVIPIPYTTYDRQKKSRTFHYEGNRFPEDVEIIDYLVYDFSVAQPDVIFISNPYDDNNIVTETLAEFQSQNLLRYTSKLVYIPYFITYEHMSDNYYLLPSVERCWKIFVSSRVVREQYLKNKNLSANQVVAIGSPKADRMLRPQEMRKPVEEWISLAAGRKIFLLVTSLGTMLKDTSEFLEYLCGVYELAKARQDIVMLWRPHPLSLETLLNMRPDFAERYREIVSSMQGLDNVIYDSTPDFYDAFMVSDAYIGHYSSLAILYGLLGKPVYLYRGKYMGRMKKPPKYMFTWAALIVDGKVWYPQAYSDEVTIRNFSGTEVDRIVSGMDEIQRGPHYAGLARYKESLWVMPYFQNNIIKIDIHTKKAELLELPVETASNETLGKFSSYIAEAPKVWFIPQMSNSVVCLDMESGRVINYCEIPDKYGFREDEMKFQDAVIQDKILWMVSRERNLLVGLDTVTGELHDIRFEYHGKVQWGGLTTDGTYFWIVSYIGRKVLKIDYSGNIVKELQSWPEGLNLNAGFKQAFYADGLVWFMPVKSNMIIYIDTADDTMHSIQDFPEEIKCMLERGEVSWGNSVKEDNIITVPLIGTGYILRLDLENKSVKVDQILFGAEKASYIRSSVNKRFMYESTRVSLEDFIDFMNGERDTFSKERIRYHKKFFENADGTSGKKILQYILKHLEREMD